MSVRIDTPDTFAIVAGILLGLWLLRKPFPLLAEVRPKTENNIVPMKERIS